MRTAYIRALRTPLMTLAVTVLLGTGAVLYSGRDLDDARKLLEQRETQLEQARARTRNADEERELIARFAGNYEELARNGFAGEEQRINWLDGLRVANEQTRTFGVEYDIGARRAYLYASEFSAAPLQLDESLMKLRLQLLHEQDLPRFLGVLARNGGGFFTVDRCVLRRLRHEDLERSDRVQPNVAAECELRWLTVRLAAAEKKR